jgi:hypothetical protein
LAAKQTWTAYYPEVSFTGVDPPKNMAAILNAHAAEILRIRRVGINNAHVAAVAGNLRLLELRRYTGATLVGSTAVVPTPHVTANVAPAAATYGYAGAVAGVASLLRSVLWSCEESIYQNLRWEELETLVPLNIIWDAGYGEHSVQPLALRQDEMICLYLTFAVGAPGSGFLDTWIEFTKE